METKTNADRIRAMTDEELATVLSTGGLCLRQDTRGVLRRSRVLSLLPFLAPLPGGGKP